MTSSPARKQIKLPGRLVAFIAFFGPLAVLAALMWLIAGSIFSAPIVPGEERPMDPSGTAETSTADPPDAGDD
ncbi:MAG: hypothetical protein AAF747_07420 [Planctomycetota bacterium]